MQVDLKTASLANLTTVHVNLKTDVSAGDPENMTVQVNLKTDNSANLATTKKAQVYLKMDNNITVTRQWCIAIQDKNAVAKKTQP